MGFAYFLVGNPLLMVRLWQLSGVLQSAPAAVPGRGFDGQCVSYGYGEVIFFPRLCR